MPEVKQRHTNFTSKALSDRHRFYGWDAPLVDIDFLMIEYDHGNPVCLVEYKHCNQKEIDIDHNSMKAIKILADNSGIPFVIAKYWPKVWAYLVIPVNEIAHKHFSGPTELTEYEYVKWLYTMRTAKFAGSVKIELQHSRIPK